MVLAFAPRTRAQATPAAVKQDDVSILAEFKVYAKKPVPFTDASMAVPAA